jgi:multiple antibiotic resistance protein
VQDTLQAIVTVLALINPVMCGAIFMQIEGERPVNARLADATRAALAVLVILVLAALVGVRILHLFGVSLDAFSVAGGAVLSWIGFSMLRGNPPAANDPKHDGSSPQPALTPLILFAASPGTITGVITLAVAHSKDMFPVTALVAVAVGTVVMWLAIGLAIYMGSRAGGSGFVHDTVTRFMGLIVVAMGVQFALTGIRAFMMASA